MDFWDIFIKEEQSSNTNALATIGEHLVNFEKEVEQYTMLVYTDFVDVNEIDRDELIAAVALLNNIGNIKRKLSPAAIVILYCFYNMIYQNHEKASGTLNELFGVKIAKFIGFDSLEENFNHAIEIYSNFNNTNYLEGFDFQKLTGKLMIVNGKQIVVVYLVEREEDV